MVTGDHKNILPLPSPSKKNCHLILKLFPTVPVSCLINTSNTDKHCFIHQTPVTVCKGDWEDFTLSAVSFRVRFDCNYKSASLIQPRALADPNPPPATTGNHPIRSIIIYTSVMYLAAPPLRFVQELPPSVHYLGGCLLTGHPSPYIPY